MGTVNWLAVLVATCAALGFAAVWYGPIHGRARLEEVGPGGLGQRTAPGQTVLLTIAALLISAAMIGHMFARVGPATLTAKPWLFFMMTGGIAGAFVVPALVVNYSNLRVSRRLALIDAGFWMLAYLTMGLVFFLFRVLYLGGTPPASAGYWL